MQGAINLCLEDDTSKRPDFKLLQGEVEAAIITEYCIKGTDADDEKAVAFIQQTHDFLLDYKERGLGWTVLHRACYNNRVRVVRALVAKGVYLNIQNNAGYTALDYCVLYKNQASGEYLYSVGGRCNCKTYPSEWKQ